MLGLCKGEHLKMYYMRGENLGELGVLPALAIPAIIGGATSVLGIGAKIWGEGKVEDAQKDAIKKAQLADKRAKEAAAREALRQAEEAARQQGLVEQSAIIDEAKARRNISVMALYAVGGVAVLVSGAFIFAAMKRKPKQGK